MTTDTDYNPDTDLDAIADGIRARIKKARTSTQPKKRSGFEISAGYQLAEAKKLVSASDWWAWCDEVIKESRNEIARLLGMIVPYVAPPPPEAPPKPKEANWGHPGWVDTPEDRVRRMWDAARQVFEEYFVIGAALTLDGELDHEEHEIWAKWFERFSRALDIPQVRWDEFLAEVSPVFDRCRRDLREFYRRERRAWRAAESVRKARERARADAAAAFVYDRAQTWEENHRRWCDPTGWKTLRTGSFQRDTIIAANGESWRVLIFQRDGLWGIRLNPPKASAFPPAYSPESYPTAQQAMEQAPRFITRVIERGGQ